MDVTPGSALISVKGAIAILPLSSWKIIELARGQLKSIRLGRRYYFPVEDILKLRMYGTASPTKQQSVQEAAAV
jgi:hypothetical protein